MPVAGELVFAAPRRAKPPRHLADLTPAERREVVEALGERPFRADQLATHYFAHLLDDPAAMTDLPARARGPLAAALLPTAAHAGAPPRLRRRHDPQDGLAALRRRDRRERAHALPGPGDHVRLVAGRLRHELPVLRDRPGRPDPQHVGRRDRRPGRGRGALAAQRRAGRRSPTTRRCGSPTSSSWAWASRSPTTAPCWAPCAGSPTRRRAASASPQRSVTVSTVGLVPAMDKLTAEGLSVTLALSLHAPDDELRDTLVPVNTRWKVAEVLDAARRLLRGDRPPGQHRVRPHPRHQRPRLAGRPAGHRAQPARPRLGARQPDPAQPHPGVEVDRERPAGRAHLRPAAARPRHPDDGPRHPRPGDRRRLRPARGGDRVTTAATAMTRGHHDRYPRVSRWRKGYHRRQVDAFVSNVEVSLSGMIPMPTATDIRRAGFELRHGGYDTSVVDAALDDLEGRVLAVQRMSAGRRGKADPSADAAVLREEVSGPYMQRFPRVRLPPARLRPGRRRRLRRPGAGRARRRTRRQVTRSGWTTCGRPSSGRGGAATARTPSTTPSTTWSST